MAFPIGHRAFALDSISPVGVPTATVLNRRRAPQQQGSASPPPPPPPPSSVGLRRLKVLSLPSGPALFPVLRWISSVAVFSPMHFSPPRRWPRHRFVVSSRDLSLFLGWCSALRTSEDNVVGHISAGPGTAFVLKDFPSFSRSLTPGRVCHYFRIRWGSADHTARICSYGRANHRRKLTLD